MESHRDNQREGGVWNRVTDRIIGSIHDLERVIFFFWVWELLEVLVSCGSSSQIKESWIFASTWLDRSHPIWIFWLLFASFHLDYSIYTSGTTKQPSSSKCGLLQPHSAHSNFPQKHIPFQLLSQIQNEISQVKVYFEFILYASEGYC